MNDTEKLRKAFLDAVVNYTADIPYDEPLPDEQLPFEDKWYKCIDGSRRKKGVIGMCLYEQHTGALTKELLEKHECIRKNCFMLVKFPEKPFWKHYENKKERLRYNKAKKRRWKEIKHTIEEYLQDITDIRMKGAEPYKDGVKVFVYMLKTQHIKEISDELQEKLNMPVYMVHIKLSYTDTVKALGDKFKTGNKRAERLIQMDKIVSHSRENQPDIVISDLCGCYNCKKMFSPNQIKEYVAGAVFSTAKCPICGKLTVLPQHPDYVLSKLLLNNVHQHVYRPAGTPKVKKTYIGNPQTKKLHTPACRYAAGNSQVTFTNPQKAITKGYTLCKYCLDGKI